jgi:hypothetical protein
VRITTYQVDMLTWSFMVHSLLKNIQGGSKLDAYFGAAKFHHRYLAARITIETLGINNAPLPQEGVGTIVSLDTRAWLLSVEDWPRDVAQG